MASDWALTEFRNETANIIMSMLSQDHTFEGSLSVYKYALSPGNEVLMDILLHHLAWNFERLVKTPSWTNLPSSLVADLLSRSDLVVSKETVVLQSLENWAAAQGTKAVPPQLLQLIRFPMIPVEDLYLLREPQYHAGKCEGFQFQAVLFSSNWTEANRFRPRIYTGRPWSYSINHHMMEQLRKGGSPSQGNVTKAFAFHTPFHNSALFTYSNAKWRLILNVSSDECGDTPPAVADLNPILHVTMERKSRDQFWRCIHFNNKLIVECAGSTVRVDDFEDRLDGDFLYKPGRAGVTFPCNLKQFSYKVVIRPECRPWPRKD